MKQRLSARVLSLVLVAALLAGMVVPAHTVSPKSVVTFTQVDNSAVSVNPLKSSDDGKLHTMDIADNPAAMVYRTVLRTELANLVHRIEKATGSELDVIWTVGGIRARNAVPENQDFNGDGIVNTADGQTLLDYATGLTDILHDKVNGKKFLLQVFDYAMNRTTCLIEMQIGESVDLPEMMAYDLVSHHWAGFDKTFITKVVIKDGIHDIDQMAFYELPNLAEVVLPESVVEIRNYAFKNFTKLTTINLEVVEFIREGAFYGCSALEDVTFANHVIIDDWAFSKIPVVLP